ncbi:MAG: DUF2254 domain-containing protein [Rhizobium sp.]|nr:DUF2254 domain-containing protein [Rhizobium sp.]
MISRYAWYLREVLRKVWVRVASFAALAIVSAVLARVLSPYLPTAISLHTGSEAVSQLLGVLTSSMLAVTTFSLSIAVSAFAAAAGSATPRATVLLQEDRTTQNVLATFLGAFLFGLVGLVALYAEFYDASGKVVVFLFTIAVIGLVVVALIRWIDHLMRFGRMEDTLDRVERAAAQALGQRLDDPFLGGRPMVGPPPHGCTVVSAPVTGYVQHVDMKALQGRAEAIDAQLFLHRMPGAFVAVGEPLLSAASDSLDQDEAQVIRRAFAIGTRRTFEGDPRFGLIVLTEIASRALSPGVNDPGTAIEILGRLVRILSQWREPTEPEIRFDRVHVPPITARDALEDAFKPIARDGAALAEVQLRLVKSLASLGRLAPGIFVEPAHAITLEALAHSEAASLLETDLVRLRVAAGLAPAPVTPVPAGGENPL